MTWWERIIAWLLFSLGLLGCFYFLNWWAVPGTVASPVLFALFTFVAWFSVFRMVANWYALINVTRPLQRPPLPGMTVDVFTTAAPGEPLEMFRTTLAALNGMRYPHRTYLLDDSHSDDLRALCSEIGVHYLRRDRPGEDGKAGNVNAALHVTSGDFVAIFDPDHVPQPEFLERVLGHFSDPRVGFVQAAQAYYNQDESYVARGAAEQTYELYGPTMMGLHGIGSPLLFGCHTTFRRVALESIGGYAVHNAEDLRTTMRLYAKGWKGVYVPEILARGLVPADLFTYFRQQYRWAHSVFDLLFRDYWRLCWHWTLMQCVAFLSACTYYFVGVAILISLFLPVLFLLSGWAPVASDARSFLEHMFPLLLANFVIRRFGQRFFLDRKERGWHVFGMTMLFASCFAHTAGLVAALRNVRVPYLVTAKGGSGQAESAYARPHALVAAASCGAVLYSIWMGQPQDALLMQACAAWNAAVMGTAVWIAHHGDAGGRKRGVRASSG